MRNKYILRNEGLVLQIHDPYQWTLGDAYDAGEMAYNNGVSYFCISPHTADAAHEPGVGDDWEDVFQLLAVGKQGPQGIPGGVMNWRGVYNASTTYAVNDAVRSAEGYGYYSLQDNNVGHAPPTDGSDNAYWSCFAWKGEKGDTPDTPDTPDAWIAGETWTYLGADAPTYTFTISGDKTSKYSPGMRIKLTQTTVKYFIIVAVSYSYPNTTVTIYGGTDYTLENAAITDPYYSMVKAPAGFPLDPAKWTVSATLSGVQSNPT
ncbi:hypothetical protein, partial [Mitsuokella multacida]|uniref:hypothetical protein n=1 Tax=Mitsuokella multacida TaxID=52226 RepID=UPI003FA1EC84